MNTDYKRAVLQKKRLEVALAEAEIRIIDMLNEIEKLKENMETLQKSIVEKENEIQTIERRDK
jgi:chromosome segregation ATPase